MTDLSQVWGQLVGRSEWHDQDLKICEWFFDAAAGREEVINRRVGSNELGAIQTFVATLDKYVGGPCIPCNDTRFSTPTGNDGTIVINFTSATTATVLLPGGRVANIVPAVQ